MKRNIIILFILVVFSILFVYFRPKNSDTLLFVMIGKYRYFVELADTDAKRAQGLSDRDILPPDSGMLFEFPDTDIYRFWMKGMKFPLDFIWIKDSLIVDISENVLPSTDPQNTTTIEPKEPVNFVLEINAGEVKNKNIRVGDSVKFQLR